MTGNEQERVFLAATRGVAKTANLGALLGAPVVAAPRLGRSPSRLLAASRAVLAWGRKPSVRRAESLATRHGLSLWRVEVGFLRSLGLGGDEPPLSLVVDRQGIYYDASASSELEGLIAKPLSEAERRRAEALVGHWRETRVSKYNHNRDPEGALPERFVLLVDQTRGDAAIRLGQADAESFARMLAAAREAYPEHTLLLKVHPEVAVGRKPGHFDLAALAEDPRIRVLGEDVHPARLLAEAEAVFTVTSQMGFEALLWGKPVHTFGMPFYAGWGLTEDALPAPPQRRVPVSLAQLVYGALIAYPRYLDPETHQPCEVERLVDWLGLQRRMRERFPREMVALGFAPWRHAGVRRFVAGSRLTFTRRPERLSAGQTALVWGYKPLAERLPAGVPVVRIEDGFIRSVGLGANLVRPLSWAIDRQGLYYDATRASDLESLLEAGIEDPELLARAARLRRRIVEAGITKYNLGQASWRRPEGAARVILVPGQVESDASLAYGALGLKRNMQVLQAVREANPEAYVIYKPHPDVVAGARRVGEAEDRAEQWCDEVVTEVGMHALLDQVDEVHLLTSLTGFEALLRGKRVVCYGAPFYAGWGLTEDRLAMPRRRRRLSLDALVAGVLIRYPTYVSRLTGHFTTPERVLDERVAQGAAVAGGPRPGLAATK